MAPDSRCITNNTPTLTISKLNTVCMQEVTSHLDRYIDEYWGTDVNISDFFVLFMNHTFNMEIPNIFIEVYLEHPMNIPDNIKQSIYNVIQRWLHVEDPSSIHEHRLLTRYAHAWTLCNRRYFEHYITTYVCDM